MRVSLQFTEADQRFALLLLLQVFVFEAHGKVQSETAADVRCSSRKPTELSKRPDGQNQVPVPSWYFSTEKNLCLIFVNYGSTEGYFKTHKDCESSCMAVGFQAACKHDNSEISCVRLQCDDGFACEMSADGFAMCCNSTIIEAMLDAHTATCPNGNKAYKLRHGGKPLVADDCQSIMCPRGYRCLAGTSGLVAKCCQMTADDRQLLLDTNEVTKENERKAKAKTAKTTSTIPTTTTAELLEEQPAESTTELTDESVVTTAATTTADDRPCFQPKHNGSCSNQSNAEFWVNKWFFSQATKECLAFRYFGCDGNKNNFDSKTACELSCKPADGATCASGLLPLANNNGLALSADNCEDLSCPSGWKCKVGWQQSAFCCNASVEEIYENAFSSTCENGRQALMTPSNAVVELTLLAESCADIACPEDYECVASSLFAKCCSKSGEVSPVSDVCSEEDLLACSNSHLNISAMVLQLDSIATLNKRSIASLNVSELAVKLTNEIADHDFGAPLICKGLAGLKSCLAGDKFVSCETSAAEFFVSVESALGNPCLTSKKANDSVPAMHCLQSVLRDSDVLACLKAARDALPLANRLDEKHEDKPNGFSQLCANLNKAFTCASTAVGRMCSPSQQDWLTNFFNSTLDLIFGDGCAQADSIADVADAGKQKQQVEENSVIEEQGATIALSSTTTTTIATSQGCADDADASYAKFAKCQERLANSLLKVANGNGWQSLPTFVCDKLGTFHNCTTHAYSCLSPAENEQLARLANKTMLQELCANHDSSPVALFPRPPRVERGAGSGACLLNVINAEKIGRKCRLHPKPNTPISQLCGDLAEYLMCLRFLITAHCSTDSYIFWQELLTELSNLADPECDMTAIIGLLGKANSAIKSEGQDSSTASCPVNDNDLATCIEPVLNLLSPLVILKSDISIESLCSEHYPSFLQCVGSDVLSVGCEPKLVSGLKGTLKYMCDQRSADDSPEFPGRKCILRISRSSKELSKCLMSVPTLDLKDKHFDLKLCEGMNSVLRCGLPEIAKRCGSFATEYVIGVHRQFVESWNQSCPLLPLTANADEPLSILQPLTARQISTRPQFAPPRELFTDLPPEGCPMSELRRIKACVKNFFALLVPVTVVKSVTGLGTACNAFSASNSCIGATACGRDQVAGFRALFTQLCTTEGRRNYAAHDECMRQLQADPSVEGCLKPYEAVGMAPGQKTKLCTAIKDLVVCIKPAVYQLCSPEAYNLIVFYHTTFIEATDPGCMFGPLPRQSATKNFTCVAPLNNLIQPLSILKDGEDLNKICAQYVEAITSCGLSSTRKTVDSPQMAIVRVLSELCLVHSVKERFAKSAACFLQEIHGPSSTDGFAMCPGTELNSASVIESVSDLDKLNDDKGCFRLEAAIDCVAPNIERECGLDALQLLLQLNQLLASSLNHSCNLVVTTTVSHDQDKSDLSIAENATKTIARAAPGNEDGAEFVRISETFSAVHEANSIDCAVGSVMTIGRCRQRLSETVLEILGHGSAKFETFAETAGVASLCVSIEAYERCINDIGCSDPTEDLLIDLYRLWCVSQTNAVAIVRSCVLLGFAENSCSGNFNDTENFLCSDQSQRYVECLQPVLSCNSVIIDLLNATYLGIKALLGLTHCKDRPPSVSVNNAETDELFSDRENPLLFAQPNATSQNQVSVQDQRRKQAFSALQLREQEDAWKLLRNNGKPSSNNADRSNSHEKGSAQFCTNSFLKHLNPLIVIDANDTASIGELCDNYDRLRRGSCRSSSALTVSPLQRLDEAILSTLDTICSESSSRFLYSQAKACISATEIAKSKEIAKCLVQQSRFYSGTFTIPRTSRKQQAESLPELLQLEFGISNGSLLCDTTLAMLRCVLPKLSANHCTVGATKQIILLQQSFVETFKPFCLRSLTPTTSTLNANDFTPQRISHTGRDSGQTACVELEQQAKAAKCKFAFQQRLTQKIAILTEASVGKLGLSLLAFRVPTMNAFCDDLLLHFATCLKQLSCIDIQGAEIAENRFRWCESRATYAIIPALPSCVNATRSAISRRSAAFDQCTSIPLGSNRQAVKQVVSATTVCAAKQAYQNCLRPILQLASCEQPTIRWLDQVFDDLVASFEQTCISTESIAPPGRFVPQPIQRPPAAQQFEPPVSLALPHSAKPKPGIIAPAPVRLSNCAPSERAALARCHSSFMPNLQSLLHQVVSNATQGTVSIRQLLSRSAYRQACSSLISFEACAKNVSCARDMLQHLRAMNHRVCVTDGETFSSVQQCLQALTENPGFTVCQQSLSQTYKGVFERASEIGFGQFICGKSQAFFGCVDPLARDACSSTTQKLLRETYMDALAVLGVQCSTGNVTLSRAPLDVNPFGAFAVDGLDQRRLMLAAANKHFPERSMDAIDSVSDLQKVSRTTIFRTIQRATEPNVTISTASSSTRQPSRATTAESVQTTAFISALIQDCNSKRKTALLFNRRIRRNAVYVPTCSIDGRFEPVQCKADGSACWCVDAVSGAEIPKTRTTSGQSSGQSLSCAAMSKHLCEKQSWRRDCGLVVNGTALRPQPVVRWFSDGIRCKMYMHSYCADELAVLAPNSNYSGSVQTIRYKQDCIRHCLENTIDNL